MIHMSDYVYDLEIDVRKVFPEIPLLSIYESQHDIEKSNKNFHFGLRKLKMRTILDQYRLTYVGGRVN